MLHLAVHPEIAAVNVSRHIGHNSRMVECRIEFRQVIVIVRGRHLYLAQPSVPLVAGRLAGPLEVESRHFCRHILCSAFAINRRESDLYKQLVTAFYAGERQQRLAARTRLIPLMQSYRIFYHLQLERLGEYSIEIDILIGERPAPGAFEALKLSVAHLVELHIVVALKPERIVQIDNHTGLSVHVGRISEPVDGHSRRCGHLCLNAVAVEKHRIVAGLGSFVAVAESGCVGHIACITGICAVDYLFANGRHDQYVA